MASILDIGPLTASVTVRGVTFALEGIGSDSLVALLDKFPALYNAMGRGTSLSAADLTKLGPDVVASIIVTAANTATADIEAATKIVKSFTIGEQIEVLEPIVRMTFPRGFGPFVEALNRVAESAGGELSGKVPDTK